MSDYYASLIADARNSELDDEARLRALMNITAAHYEARTRKMDAAVGSPGRGRPRGSRNRKYRNALDALADIGTDVPVRKPRQAQKSEPTIKASATELMMQVNYHDDDGQPVGLPYDEICRRILERFPVVTLRGAHYGRPTKMDRKEGQELAYTLRRSGVTLPGRPRRRKVRGAMAQPNESVASTVARPMRFRPKSGGKPMVNESDGPQNCPRVRYSGRAATQLPPAGTPSRRASYRILSGTHASHWSR